MNKPKLQRDKLYIGNIDYSVSLEELEAFIKDKADLNIKESKMLEGKGVAFATFHSEEDAFKVKDAINGVELKSRKLKVDIAQHRAAPEKKRFKPRKETS